MSRDPFARMNESLSARLGEEAFLNSTQACRAEISKDVAVNGEHGEVLQRRTVINIFYMPDPKPVKGDVLTVSTGPFMADYILDALVKEDGYSAQWIVR